MYEAQNSCRLLRFVKALGSQLRKKETDQEPLKMLLKARLLLIMWNFLQLSSHEFLRCYEILIMECRFSPSVSHGTVTNVSETYCDRAYGTQQRELVLHKTVRGQTPLCSFRRSSCLKFHNVSLLKQF